MAEAIARVHVNDFDPEVYRGDDALIVALRMADVFRADFPGAVVGVSYNPEAAESKRRIILARFGLDQESSDPDSGS
jgi:hypothetical protein